MKFSNPSFCFIAPTQYLKYTSASRTHLVLAHLIDQDTDNARAYTAFYKARADEGDFIMLDNSAYELLEPYAPEKLVELGRAVGAKAIVLPDYPFQSGIVTINAANEFMDVIKDAGFHTFFVPQSERGDLDDWIAAYSWAANDDRIDIIGMSILGIPNALPAIDPSYARVVMTNLLQSNGLFNSDKHHHYLGLNSGPALEIPSLIRMDALDTIDSSGPIWAAILGHSYNYECDSLQAVKKLKMPVQFDYPMTKDEATLFRIDDNVRMTEELFDEDLSTDAWYAQE